MKKTWNLSELIINDEDYKKLETEPTKVKDVKNGDVTRRITWIDNAKDIKKISTPDGHILTPEELFDFVIGDKMDLLKNESEKDDVADIAIVLGNIGLKTTRERAIKAFELYKMGRVKKIIFTGGISKTRDKKGLFNPETLEDYMNPELADNLEWEDLPEADWGASTLVEDVFDEDYQKHISELTDELIHKIGINPEDILIEASSTTTLENAINCKNIFDVEAIETGTKINTAILITTCTHGNRATRQFSKVFGDGIKLKWCPSTLDLESHETLRNILRAPKFDEKSFMEELKRIYCTTPELTQMLREEVGHNRNAFINGDIDEPKIVCEKEDRTNDSDEER